MFEMFEIFSLFVVEHFFLFLIFFFNLQKEEQKKIGIEIKI